MLEAAGCAPPIWRARWVGCPAVAEGNCRVAGQTHVPGVLENRAAVEAFRAGDPYGKVDLFKSFDVREFRPGVIDQF